MIPLRDTEPCSSTPIVTYSLITINVVIFIYQITLPPHQLEIFIKKLGIIPALFDFPHFPFITLLTSMFLHGSMAHLVGNMWSLWIFGDNVEDKMGHINFLIFYLLTGIAAGITHIILNPNSPIPTIGASGAISGVMGAYFFMFPRSTIIFMVVVIFTPLFIELPASVYILGWFGAQLFGGILIKITPLVQHISGIAFWAHIGGFVAGGTLYKAFIKKRSNGELYYSDEYLRKWI